MNSIVDVFAGPGGWEEGLKRLGHTNVLGIEWDEAACKTAEAAGHRRLRADVAALDPLTFQPVWGFLGSPPCQSYSMTGKQLGQHDRAAVEHVAERLAEGSDERASVRVQDSRSMLTVEPLRWALALRPHWVALEQVPQVLPLWKLFGDLLRKAGYHVAVGKLSAEQFGVPQNRIRAFLIASLDGPVALPKPVHQTYDIRKRGPKKGTEHLRPYVTMADALGCPPGVALRSNYGTGGIAANRGERAAADPAPTITSKVDRNKWLFRTDTRTEAPIRALSAPAPTIKGGHSYAERRWVRDDGQSVRVSLEEAAVLQSFRPDYPWQGNKGQRFQQVGNAVPPLLAAAVAQEAMRYSI